MSDYNPLDTEGQQAKGKTDADKAKQAQRLEVDDVKWLMSNPRGRRVCQRFLERSGVYRSSFNTNGMTMAFNEGMRNEGLRLLASINAACPDLYLTLLKETNE